MEAVLKATVFKALLIKVITRSASSVLMPKKSSELLVIAKMTKSALPAPVNPA